MADQDNAASEAQGAVQSEAPLIPDDAQGPALVTEEPEGAATPGNGRTASPVIVGADAVRQRIAAGGAAGLKLLSTADILAADDTRYQIVDVPEWGGEVIIRNLSGTERDAFEASLVRQTGGQRTLTTLNIRAKLCALTIVDPTDPALRKRAFDDKAIAKLGAKSAAALARVYDASAALSGISEADTKELEGNSEKAASDDSSLKLP